MFPPLPDKELGKATLILYFQSTQDVLGGVCEKGRFLVKSLSEALGQATYIDLDE